MTEEEKVKAAEEAAKAAEAKKSEEEGDDYVKDGGQVDANKHNQTLRKAREAEAEKRELEAENAKLAEAIKNKPKPTQPIPPVKKEKDDEEDEDDFWADGTKKEKKPVEPIAPQVNPDDIETIINEKIRPFVESEQKRGKVEKKNARASFYEEHPEYLNDPDKWAELLDELSASIVPSADYYQDLEKAHRIIGGEDFNQAHIEQKKKEIANDAGASGGSSQRGKPEDTKLSAMDKKIMEGTDVSAETMKSMRQMQKDGLLSIEF